MDTTSEQLIMDLDGNIRRFGDVVMSALDVVPKNHDDVVSYIQKEYMLELTSGQKQYIQFLIN